MKIKDIIIDPDIQLRDRLDAATVERYVEMLEVSEPPPVVVFDGNLLADGFHRVASSKKAGREEIPAEHKEGGREEAIAYAVTANTRHGLPLTRGERNEGIRRLYALGWTTRRIAEAMAVNQATVSRVTREEAIGKELPDDLMHLHQGHKIAIGSLPEEQQEMVARVVDEEDLSERQTRDVVRAVKTTPDIDQAGIRLIVKDVIKQLEDADAWSALRRYKVAVHDLQRFTVKEVVAALPPEEHPGWASDLDDIIDFLERVRGGL